MPKPYKIKDKYFLHAKEKGYRARSAFKLLDIQKKFKLIKRGHKVVDLGAAPGSFSQVIAEITCKERSVLGLDLQAIENFESSSGAEFILTRRCDIMETEKVMDILKEEGFLKIDVLTSDLAPKTSGIKDLDHGLSVDLADQAFYIARQALKPGGHFIAKVFDGPELPILLKRIKRKFKQVRLFKPDSCRDRSKEKYIVGISLQK